MSFLCFAQFSTPYLALIQDSRLQRDRCSNCKPFGGPPTLSGPWTLHLGPFLDLKLLKLGPWVYLQCVLGGLEGYLCLPWGIWIYPGSVLGLFCDGLRVMLSTLEPSCDILRRSWDILGLSWGYLRRTWEQLGSKVTLLKRTNRSRSAPVQRKRCLLYTSDAADE